MKMNQIPKFAQWLMKVFLLKSEHSEKLGDYEEGFYQEAEDSGFVYAYLWYWGQVCLALPVFIKNS